jgi:hypothetical protein
MIYKSSLWKKLDSKNRYFKVFILGTLFYIILSSFLYSKYVENNEIVQKYKKYVYYMMGIDVGCTSFAYGRLKSSKPKQKSKLKERENSCPQMINTDRYHPIQNDRLELNNRLHNLNILPQYLQYKEYNQRNNPINSNINQKYEINNKCLNTTNTNPDNKKQSFVQTINTNSDNKKNSKKSIPPYPENPLELKNLHIPIYESKKNIKIVEKSK